MVTRSRIKGSQKQETRTVARNVVIKFCSSATWIAVQKALMDGSLEESVSEAVSKVQPVRSVFFRRSQLIQDGVVIDDGPTLEEIKAEEKATKEAATKESEEIQSVEEVSEINEDAIVDEEIVEEDVGESQDSEQEDELDYESMTVPQLKALLKEAGKPVSGKKADLIARLSE